MTQTEIISIAILAFSVVLFLFHFYLIFIQKKLDKALENKKLNAQKREEDEERLKIITKMLLDDKELAAKVKSYEDANNFTKSIGRSI